MVVEYLKLLVEGNCGKTVPRTRLAALATFERFAGFEAGYRFSEDALVVETANQAEIQVSASSAPVVKSPCPPLIYVVALELFATLTEFPPYLRFLACAQLLMIYSSMRADDAQGLDTSTIHFSKKTWQALLSRTKVSGAGRKQHWLAIFVSRSCTLSGALWLETLEVMLSGDEFGLRGTT